jgi:hypothetical protein
VPGDTERRGTEPDSRTGSRPRHPLRRQIAPMPPHARARREAWLGEPDREPWRVAWGVQAPSLDFQNEQPCHDRLARAWVLREQGAHARQLEEILVDRFQLVRQEINPGNGQREIGVILVRESNDPTSSSSIVIVDQFGRTPTRRHAPSPERSRPVPRSTGCMRVSDLPLRHLASLRPDGPKRK